MHRFRDMTTYWSKIAEKNPTHRHLPRSFWGDPLRIFRWIIPCQKLEWWGYQTVYTSRSCFRSAIGTLVGAYARRVRRGKPDADLFIARTYDWRATDTTYQPDSGQWQYPAVSWEIPACDRRTSRPTDRQTDRHVAVAKTRASIASRG